MIAQFFSAELAVILPFVIIALVVFAIVALVTARRDPDPAGSRPYAIYLVLIIFLSMFTALFALTSVASSIAKIPQSNSDGYYGPLGAALSGPGANSIEMGAARSALAARGIRLVGGVSKTSSGIGYQNFSYDPSKQATASAVEAALVALVALG